MINILKDMNQINQNDLNEMELCRYDDDEILTEEEYYEMLNKEEQK